MKYKPSEAGYIIIVEIGRLFARLNPHRAHAPVYSQVHSAHDADDKPKFKAETYSITFACPSEPSRADTVSISWEFVSQVQEPDIFCRAPRAASVSV